MDKINVADDQFPARSQDTSGTIGGVQTDITRLDFSDRILLTISQEGRLSQWVQVPLASLSPNAVEQTISSSRGLLPSTHLTPTTLLGGGGNDRETLGQLYAAQLASAMSLRSPDDTRTLVLGLGLKTMDTADREAFFDLLELATKII